MSAAKRKAKGSGGRSPASAGRVPASDGRSKALSGRGGQGAAGRGDAEYSVAGRADSSAPGAGRAGALARWAVWGIAVLPPFLFSATADDAFRLPKTVAAESLALLSLLAIAVGWWNRRAFVSLADLARRPATAFAALLGAAMLPGVLFAVHPEHWRRAAVGTTIALACLMLWSARVPERTLRRALDLLVIPAVALASLAILQFFDIFRPFAFARGNVLRYELTSVAGSVGDLAAFLVLPLLVLQAGLLRARRTGARVAIGVLLAVMTYTLFVSQTLAALLAITVATLLFWALVLPRRRRWLLGAPLVVVVLAALILPGLSRRVEAKYRDVKGGNYDALLSGRPDGWKASLEMFREHPFFGVGHGGYGASFAPAKLALAERGADFWGRGRTAFFVNAHNDYLEALAEWGLWGAIVSVGALLLLARALHRLARDSPPPDRALAFAGCAACAVLALASFPLRIALTGYPWLLLVAWIFARSSGSPAAVVSAATDGESESERDSGRVAVPARAWSAALVLVLLPALAIHVLSLLGRLHASRIVRTTGQVAQLALAQGEAAARPVLQANLQPLRYAAQLDPLAIGVPLVTGSHYLLLGNGSAAVESYEHGLAIEPRAEIYFNLARALLFLGRRDQAVAHADIAVTLDPQLDEDAVALGLLEARPPRQEQKDEEADGKEGRRRGRRAVRRSEKSARP